MTAAGKTDERKELIVMYFGAPVWPLQWDPPYDEPIKRLHALGFKGVEMIGWSRKALDEYYTPETYNAPKIKDTKVKKIS